SPDGSQLVSTGSDGSVRLWDAATGKGQRRLDRLNKADALQRSGAAFSADGKRLFLLRDHGAAVLDLTNNRIIRTVPPPAPTKRVQDALDDVRSVCVRAGRFVLCGAAQTLAEFGPDGVIHIWDLTTGRERTPDIP